MPEAATTRLPASAAAGARVPAHQPLERPQAEVGDGHRPRHQALYFLRERAGRLGRRPLPGDDHGVGPVERLPTFPPRSRGQRPAHRAGRLRAHDQDVEVAADVEPLVRVVEHEYLRPVGERPLGARRAIRIGDHHRPRDGVLVNQRLIAAVAAEQHTGNQAARDVVAGDPDRDRGLARSADGEIADRDGRQREIVHRKPSAAVREASHRHRAAPEPRGRQERQAGEPRVGPSAGPQPAHDPVRIAPPRHPPASTISASLTPASVSPVASAPSARLHLERPSIDDRDPGGRLGNEKSVPRI